MTIVILDNNEEFLQFLDPELVEITETIEKGGLRTIDFGYYFQDFTADKELFRMGNKIWVYNESDYTDCLYVINTTVKQDLFRENCFTLPAEEVLVELYYAPLLTQNEITRENGFTFSTKTTGEPELMVVVNWQALNYFFGEYLNIGVVQKCLSDYNGKVGFSGTVNLMNLLRQIEEETGNVFVTRYEKDCLDNTIHRYLDFLNPINVSKPWEVNLEYDFLDDDPTLYVFDEDGNPVSDVNEDVEEADDLVLFDEPDPITNLDPENTQFRITNGLELLGTDGRVYTGEDPDVEPLLWKGTDIPEFTSETEHIVIQLKHEKDSIGLTVNSKNFAIQDIDYQVGDTDKAFELIENPIRDENRRQKPLIPDDSYFEIYNTEYERTVFRTRLNYEIGHVHEEILDLGFNLENIELELDETETYAAISPVFESASFENPLSISQMSSLINNWKNLQINKGDIIPMVVETYTVNAVSLTAAKAIMGTYSLTSNYWRRPFNPHDDIDPDNPENNKYEFLYATAYWRAPFYKNRGELHVNSDLVGATQYQMVNTRPDNRSDRSQYAGRPKMGTVETDSEDIYQIFNLVTVELKEKQTPGFSIELDVANLRNGLYNNYELHDKVYVKIPDNTALLTARVVRTSKQSHDVAANTIELSDYSNSNIKTVQAQTTILADNVSFKYPNTKNYTCRLLNMDYDTSNPDSIEYPANKLLTFQLYTVDDKGSSAKPTNSVWTKSTNAYGQTTLPLRLDPGNYELHITFGGDEEYLDCNMTVKVNVAGTKENITPSEDSSSNSKPVRATDLNETNKKYYNKYGVSPDKKTIMSVGRHDNKWYKTVFKRKCPICGSTELYWSIYWGVNEYANTGIFPATGTYYTGAKNGIIVCAKCKEKYGALGGQAEGKNLTVAVKSVSSKKTEAQTLKKGRMAVNTKKSTTKTKKVESKKERIIRGNPSKHAQQVALSIVGNSKGVAAAKKIAAWMAEGQGHVEYSDYKNFCHAPDNVLNKRRGNCCDQARTFLTLCDAAGCTEYLELRYVHVHNYNTGKGHVFARLVSKKTGGSKIVDTCKSTPWGHFCHGWGSLPGHESVYPTLPF